MDLIEILSKNGVGSVEGRAALNLTLDQVDKMFKDIEVRGDYRLRGRFFVKDVKVGKYPIVLDKLETDKTGTAILGKIYPTEDDWKNWVDVRFFDINKKKVKFRAEKVSLKKQE